MLSITVKCANLEDIRLEVRAEMTLGEWREILRKVETVSYYAPLNEFLGAISAGIKGIMDREVFAGKIA